MNQTSRNVGLMWDEWIQPDRECSVNQTSDILNNGLINMINANNNKGNGDGMDHITEPYNHAIFWNVCLNKPSVPRYHKYHHGKDRAEVKFCLATLQTDYDKQKAFFFRPGSKICKIQCMNCNELSLTPHKKPLLNRHWGEIKLSPLSGVKTQGVSSGLLKTRFSCVSKLSHCSSHWQVRTELQAFFLLPGQLIFTKATGCNFMPRNSSITHGNLAAKYKAVMQVGLQTALSTLHSASQPRKTDWSSGASAHLFIFLLSKKKSPSIHKLHTVYPPESVRTIRSSGAQRKVNGLQGHIVEWSSRCLKWVDGEHVGQLPSPGVIVILKEATGRIR